MNLTNLPSPEDLVRSELIRRFGPDALVVILFSIAVFLKAWFELGRSGVRLGRRSMAAAGSAYTAAGRLRPVAVVQCGTVTMALLALQLAWLWSAWRVGNDLSYLYSGLWASPTGWSGPTADMTLPQLKNLMNYTNADWISVGYILVCIAALVISYRARLSSRPWSRLRIARWMVALPVVVPWGSSAAMWCAYELVAAGGNALVNLLTGGESHLVIPDLGWPIVIGLIAPAYVVASSMALESTEKVQQIWSRGASVN